jgi:dipeptidyl aminopeptidase/acylaminoacyl peptidase
MLHEQAIVRFWDHDLGPGAPHLLVTAAPPTDASCPPLRDLTPDPGHGLLEATTCQTPDGRAVVTSWFEPDGKGYGRMFLVAIDLGSGERTVVASDDEHDFDTPVVSPDGAWVACLRHRRPEPTRSPAVRPWLVRLDGSGGHDPCPDLVQWPTSMTWAPDAGALFVTTDEGGHAPVFRVDLPGGEVTRLTGRGAHTAVQVSPDGESVYALWSPMDRPTAVVRYDAHRTDQHPDVLPGPPGADAPVPGSLVEVTATAADGFPLRSWLCLPEGAAAGTPAPLMVWVHGGPLGSWSSWHWRWNPWLAVAKGYAVLLPDPAFSTGYGQEMVDRGWGQWGGNPYTDVLALTDVALERDDLDADRTCLLGGSYGGYLANWVAGHTDRFRCIVTHASLWAFDQFGSTTDLPGYWKIEMGEAGNRAWTPHAHADAIATPMLVIHGDRDYRVPIGEALRLWDDLTRRGVPAKFLYFPTEGHWIQSPGNARVWYETVLAFCDEHVRGEPWRRPALL